MGLVSPQLLHDIPTPFLSIISLKAEISIAVDALPGTPAGLLSLGCSSRNHPFFSLIISHQRKGALIFTALAKVAMDVLQLSHTGNCFGGMEAEAFVSSRKYTSAFKKVFRVLVEVLIKACACHWGIFNFGDVSFQ